MKVGTLVRLLSAVGPRWPDSWPDKNYERLSDENWNTGTAANMACR